jgi:glycosyltransferase involved in cell wall biosynthesis
MVLTSRWEGLPQSIFQAMAAGVPVVATSVDGAAEAVRNHENGLLFGAGDWQQMAAGIRELLDDEPRLRRFGAQGQALVAAFSQERARDALDDFYAQLCARGEP